MDKYQQINRKNEPCPQGEIRISAGGFVQNYVQYAAKLLVDENLPQVIVKATGNAIPKAVILSEVLKRRIKNLHQESHISSVENTETYVPIEEGLDTLTFTRKLTCLEILLSTQQGVLNANNPGYQPPIDQSLVQELQPNQFRGRPRRSRAYGQGVQRGGQRGRYSDSQRRTQRRFQRGGNFPNRRSSGFRGQSQGTQQRTFNRGYDTGRPRRGRRQNNYQFNRGGQGYQRTNWEQSNNNDQGWDNQPIEATQN